MSSVISEGPFNETDALSLVCVDLLKTITNRRREPSDHEGLGVPLAQGALIGSLLQIFESESEVEDTDVCAAKFMRAMETPGCS